MKTVIHVWTHEFCNYASTPLDGRFGLGDLIRGSIGTLQYCEARGYNCILDISLHPLSNVFIPSEHRYSDLVKRNRGNIRGIFHNPEQFLDDELRTKDVVFFFSHFGLEVYDRKRTPFILTKICELLTLRSEFANYVDEMMKKVPYPSFSVLHFRLGDEDMINGNPGQYDRQIELLKSAIAPNQVLISDSARFKDLVKDIVFAFDQPPSHVGFHTKIEDIKYTVFEYILLSRATEIQTFSVYSWTSGFVKSVNYLFNIRLTTIGQ
jgi:hypothetical protein